MVRAPQRGLTSSRDPAGGGFCASHLTYSASTLLAATSRNLPCSNLRIMAKSARKACCGRHACESSTGCSSPGDRLMTLSTSAVAVCCSSASLSSLVRACTSSNSRTFSMAITAWSAKVVTSSICFSVNGSTLSRAACRWTPIGDALAQQRHAEHSPSSSRRCAPVARSARDRRRMSRI